jgi:multidrug resistance efflux pump
MEALLLGIYSFFVWLIFFKFKWLPWNTVSQVIVITLPILGLTAMILALNVVAPSSNDVRVIKYAIQILPQVQGRVIEVPAEGNKPMKKGDVLFRLDPSFYEGTVRAHEAALAERAGRQQGARRAAHGRGRAGGAASNPESRRPARAWRKRARKSSSRASAWSRTASSWPRAPATGSTSSRPRRT